MRSSQATGTSEEEEKDLVRQEDGLDEPAVPNPVSRRLPGFGTQLLILMPAFFPSRPLVVLCSVFETLAIRRQDSERSTAIDSRLASIFRGVLGFCSIVVWHTVQPHFIPLYCAQDRCFPGKPGAFPWRQSGVP